MRLLLIIACASLGCGAEAPPGDPVPDAAAEPNIDGSPTDAQLGELTALIDGVEIPLPYQFIRWDDTMPGICLASRPVAADCSASTPGVQMFERYLLQEDGTAILLAGGLVRHITEETDEIHYFRSGSLVFDVMDADNRAAAGTISALFESEVLVEGTFDIMDP